MKGLTTAAITIAILVAGTIVVATVAFPIVEKSQSVQRYNDAKEFMQTLNRVIEELSIEADGAKRVITEDVDGELIVEGAANRLRLKVPSNIEILDPGSRKENDMTIVSGAYIRAYEGDANNDGSTDLILENDALLFAVKKLGDAANFTQIDTSNIISMIKNKRSGTNIVPISRITINEKRASSSGNGFTDLLQKGDILNSGSIRVTVNSSTALYEGIFTLSTDMDFVEFSVIKITLK